MKDGITVKGFFRIKLFDKATGKVQGDSGWIKNQITNYGYNSCIVAAPIGAGSVQAAGLMLGAGTAPASDATQLPSSNTDYYQAFDTSTVVSSKTARMIATFDGTAGQATIANVGVFAASSGTVIAGNTYTQSTLSTTQTCTATYELQYS